jgi:glycosyltransferase involved in cell wall biosynthesis
MIEKGIPYPMISILIPCFNEEVFIEQCLNSVLENDYPKSSMEVFIIDGMSSDNTLNIVNNFVRSHTDVRIEIILNPKKIFPCAVNLGIMKSSGDYIFILGSHAIYNKDYFSLSVSTSQKYNAENTGGILITEGLNISAIGKAINNVLSCSFGVGNSVFRTGTDKIIESDTVFGGCYRRDVINKIGFFNENLRSTSDMDYNVRLKKSGGKIILNPAIIATYYTRNDFRKFEKNNFRNGFWSLYPLRFVDYLPVSLRHMIPLFFVCGILGGILLALFSKVFLILLLVVLGLYFLTAIYFSFKFVRNGISNCFLMPFLFLLTHLTYGAGSLLGLLKVLFFRFIGIFKR